jgi:protein MpaA
MRNIIGRSVEGKETILHANFPLRGGIDPVLARKSTLLIGGTHGDERATVDILENYVAERLATGSIPEPVAVLSLHNPDGYAAGTRYNGRGVDLNRNFTHNWDPESEEPAGPVPLSEPENQALHAFILSHRPAKIVSLHWALSELDADGPQSTPLAEAMWEALGGQDSKPYRLRVHRPETPAQGFCPGSLGQWCGNGLVYPDGVRPAMVTLELPYHPQRDERPDPLPGDHLERVQEIWRLRPVDYLSGVQDPVYRMLDAACRLEHIWPPAPEAA